MHVHDLLRHLPVNAIDLRLRFEVEMAQGESLLRFLLDLLDVVQTFQPVPALEPLLHVKNIPDELVVRLANVDLQLRRGFFDGTEGLDNQDRMMGDNRAAAFIHDRRMGYALGVANIHDVPNDVIGVFLERIIGRAIEVTPRTVVVDPKSSTDVEITQLVAKLAKLGVIARRLPDRAFYRRDIRHLRADMKMNELEAMAEAGCL